MLVMVVQIVGLSMGEKNPQKPLSFIILEYSYLFDYDTETMLAMVVQIVGLLLGEKNPQGAKAPTSPHSQFGIFQS